MLIAAMNTADVTEVDGCAVGGLCEDGPVDVGEGSKFARLLEGQLASFGVHGPGRQRRVATLQDEPDSRGNDSEGGEPALRIAGLDLLLDHTDPGDTGSF